MMHDPNHHGRPRRRAVVLALPAVILLLGPALAWGYIDPGSGSYLIQLLLAFFFGSLFVMRNFWKKVVRKAAGLFRKHGPDENVPRNP